MDLLAERVNRGLSQAAFAKKIGVSEDVVRYTESGGRPQPRNAVKFAKFFGVQVTDIWPLDREPTERAA